MVINDAHAYKELIDTTKSIIAKEGNTYEAREKICKKMEQHPFVVKISDFTFFAMSNTVTFFVGFKDGTEKIISITL